MLDLLIVAAYFLIMLTVGWRVRGSAPEGYWVGGRRYGSGKVAASLVATIFGASSTVGIIGLGYARGLTGAWWALIGGLALVPFGFFLAEKVRGLEVYTLPDILREAYGDRVAVAGALMITVAWCGVVAAQMVAGAVLLEVLVPLGFRVSLAVVSAVFILYTLWGGQLSVVRTDSWQIVLFVAALVVTLGLVWLGAGDLRPAASAIPAGHWGFPTAPGFGWYEVLVYYPLIVGLPYLVGPDVYSRVLCADGPRSARRAALLAAVGVMPLALLLALLGTLIRGLFPGVVPDEALTVALTSLAPVGLKGLIVAGILGAVMSSADTTLISASTIGSINVVGTFTRLDEVQKLRLTRVFVVTLGLVAWGVASFRQEIIGSLLLAYTVFVGGVVVPTLASFWRERLGVTPSGAFWAVVAGGTTAIIGEVADGRILSAIIQESGVGFLASVLGPQFGSILPLVVSVVVLFAVSRLSRRSGVVVGLALTLPMASVACTGQSAGPDFPPESRCPDPGVGISIGGLTSGADEVATPGRVVVLMGGGGEDDDASERFVEGAGGGDVVILRATGSATSYPNYFTLTLSPNPPPASAATVLTTQPPAAGDPSVLCWVQGAEAVWLAGGDQWDYLGRWPSSLHQALDQAHTRGAAIGGTSAGAASLGQAAFDARHGTITSQEALADPLAVEVSLSYPDFAAPELAGTLVDSHFMDRDREGRLLAFLARFLNESGRQAVMGLGLDEGVAIVIRDHSAQIYGPAGQAAWLYWVDGPATVQNGEPLELSGVERARLDPGASLVWPPDVSGHNPVSLRVADGTVQILSPGTP